MGIHSSEQGRTRWAAAAGVIELGKCMGIFPEGTRSATGELGVFKKGAFVLAIQTGASVVPAAIFGSREVMRKGSFLIKPGIVRVHYGEPIQVGGYTIHERTELTRRAQRAVSELQNSHGNS